MPLTFTSLTKGQSNVSRRSICMFELPVPEKFRCKVHWLEYSYMYIIDGGENTGLTLCQKYINLLSYYNSSVTSCDDCKRFSHCFVAGGSLLSNSIKFTQIPSRRTNKN